MRILMMPFSLFHAHNIRLIEIGQELRKRGHEVIFACRNDPSNLIKKAGFKREEVYEISAELLEKLVYKFKIVDYSSLKKMVESDLKCYQKIKPDVIFSDLRVSCKISSEVANIPYISMLNFYFTKFYKQKLALPNNYWLADVIRKLPSPLFKIISLSFSIFKKFFLWKTNLPFVKVRKKYSLDRGGKYYDQLKGNLTLICDLPDFVGNIKLDKDFKFIGPLYYAERKTLPKIKTHKKILYVTLGAEKHKNFTKSILSCIDKDRFFIILTDSFWNEKVKGGINLGFFPGLSIIEKSDLVICHGGNGTIYQSLRSGKPILCIPQNIDQTFNSDFVVRAGVGKEAVKLEKREFQKLIDELIDNKRYAANSRKFSSIIKRYNAAKNAADEVEAYFKGKI